jgi:hypothetical protein
MIKDVSSHLIAQFAEALRIQIEGTEAERIKSRAQTGEAISALTVARVGISGTVRRWLGGPESEDPK